jgi:hypothetical protein
MIEEKPADNRHQSVKDTENDRLILELLGYIRIQGCNVFLSHRRNFGLVNHVLGYELQINGSEPDGRHSAEDLLYEPVVKNHNASEADTCLEDRGHLVEGK